MSQTDWCRQTTWGPKERELFFSKLKRARNKSGYLRIQGYTLLETQEATSLAAAIELFQLALRDYPHEFENAQLYCGLGRCHEELGNFEEALQCFERSMTAQTAFPNVKSNAYLDFCWLVARQGIHAKYEISLALLEKNVREAFFPIEKYKHFGAAALIRTDLGEAIPAKENAQAAILAAGVKNSGARYHPNVGLVREFDKNLHARLSKIAS